MHKSTLLANFCTLGIVWVGDEAPLLVRVGSSCQGVEDRILVHQLLGATVVHVAHPTHLREARLACRWKVYMLNSLWISVWTLLKWSKTPGMMTVPSCCQCSHIPSPAKQSKTHLVS